MPATAAHNARGTGARRAEMISDSRLGFAILSTIVLMLLVISFPVALLESEHTAQWG